MAPPQKVPSSESEGPDSNASPQGSKPLPLTQESTNAATKARSKSNEPACVAPTKSPAAKSPAEERSGESKGSFSPLAPPMKPKPASGSIGDGEEKRGNKKRKGDETNEMIMREEGVSSNEFQSAYPNLCASFALSGCPKVSTEELMLIGKENAEKLEEQWRELKAAEHRLELKKLALINYPMPETSQS